MGGAVRLRYDDDTEAFRRELSDWLDEHAPSDEVQRSQPKRSSADMPPWAKEWQRTLFDAGWLIPSAPPEYGGRNATPEQGMVYFEEIARRDVPRSTNPQGLGIIAPSLMDFGSDEQEQRFLLPTLKGEISWCVGMSEPNAGSDLASLSTRAVVYGDHFVVNGQKVWTSGAHHADYCFCFVRTDPDVPKHKGISVLIIDMASDGITCRPLPELTDPDWADFNEVFFEDVRVPAENLVGELNRGWPMAMGSLGHERAMLWIMQAVTVERNLDRLRGLADRELPDGTRLGDDPRFRDTFAQHYVDLQGLWHLGYKGFAKAKAGDAAPEHLILKLYSTELAQRLFLDGTEFLAAEALDVSDDEGGVNWGRGSWSLQYLRSFANTIAGGTSEIQRNIISERLLGLPRA